MISRELLIVNESTLVTDADVKKMTAACNKQVRDHAAPAWGIHRVLVEFRTGTLATVQASAPKGSWVISITDDSDTAGALGWHSEDNDHVFGRIFAKPCLTDGHSTALTGPYAVSSVLSHEILETLCDPWTNGWSDTGQGLLVAQEVCDPVEADGYLIDGVQVSNFVLPEWFDTGVSAGEKYDYLGKTRAPFSMSPGGYWVQQPSGRETQRFARTLGWMFDAGFDVRRDGNVVFSPEMPGWLREQKIRTGRNITARL